MMEISTSTEHMDNQVADSIKSKTIHGVLWTSLDSVGSQGVRLIMGIILARLLLPEQFGIIGMLTIFVAVAQAILDSGFGAAIIQKKNATYTDFCSIFYFQIGIGLFVYVTLYVCAPFIAAFYEQPILVPITRVLSLIIIFNSFGWIHSTVLTKEINFKLQAIVNLAAVLVSGIIGIVFAFTGFGVWSLVAQQLSISIFRTILFWIMSSWKPSLIFSLTSLRNMFKFGASIFASAVLCQIFENIYYLIIGKLFSAKDLGFFTRAKTLADVPSYSLSIVIGRVAFPVFSKIQDDPEKLKSGLRKMLAMVSFLNFPIMLCLLAAAPNIIYALLTEKWMKSIPYFQLLLFSGVSFPLHIICMDVIRAIGKSSIYLRIEMIKKVLVVINILITFRFGLNVMIIGMFAVSVISYFLSAYYVNKMIGYSIIKQIFDVMPYLVNAIAVAVAIYFIGKMPLGNHWILMVTQLSSAILLCIVSCACFKVEAIKELNLILNVVRKKVFAI